MKVTSGRATIIGFAFAFLAFLTAFIGKLSTDELPLGIPPVLLAQIGAGVAVVTFLGRAAQGIWGQKPVHWGLGSGIAFGLAAVGTLLVLLADVGNDSILLGVPPESMAKITGFLTAALVAGRMLQSALGDKGPDEDEGPFFPPVIVEPGDLIDPPGDTPAPPDDAPPL